MFTAIATLVTTLVGGATQFFKGKQKIKQASMDNRARLAADRESNNAIWEIRALENVGAKDEVLFYAIIAVYVYSGFDPEGAATMFKNWEAIPLWFQKITMAMVASVVGLKKLSDYGPPLVKGIKDIFGK